MIDTEEKYYTGKYDKAFKEIFLKESNKDLLKVLLEAILNVKIYDIKLEPTERLSNHLKIKKKTFDCLLNTNEGLIGIEVNTSQPSYIHPRNFAYACDMYKSSTTIEDNYSENINIIQINLSFGLPKKQERIRVYKMQDEKGNMFVKNFKIIEINMDLYNKKWYDLNRLEMTTEEKEKNLSLIMIGEERDNLLELSKENKVVNKYMEELDRINKDPIFRWSISEEDDQRMIK
ncbi:MAG: PD-(D/E)XK nuclease family transposase, partial [Bacilli bacterium]|nr:PD-(D/E)XK nuclease family transposase [Bacilli bacterium]